MLLLFPSNVSAEMTNQDYQNYIDDVSYKVVSSNGSDINLIRFKTNYLRKWVKNKRGNDFPFFGFMVMKKKEKVGDKSEFFNVEQSLLFYERALELMTE